MLTKEYSIAACNLSVFEDKIQRLIKRASKLGAGEIKYAVGPEYTVRDTIDAHKSYAFHKVTVTGAAPKLNGWTFAATIEHAGEAGNILRSIPGFSVPATYRDAEPNCEHCKTARFRRETFLVQSDAGELRQVGRQCIADFLGHASPHAIAELAGIWASFGDLDPDDPENFGSGGGRGEARWDLFAFLAATSCAMREFGWTSRAEARENDAKEATADSAFKILNAKADRGSWRGKPPPEPTQADLAEAAAALAWVESEIVPKLEKSDYEHNLSVIAKLNAIGFKAFGIAASIVMVYRKAVGREIERTKRAEVSKHFGEVSKRAEFTLTVTFVKEFESNYGVTKLHKFLDANGNEAVWWASSERLDVGATYHVKATVKKHDTRDGVNQTILTRIAVLNKIGAEAVATPKPAEAAA